MVKGIKGNFTKSNILFTGTFGLLLAYIAYLCLYNLGATPIHSWDEARHGINAYEMFVTRNFWINTYQYEVDYFNFKPPLSMWVIMLNYALFGFHSFALRFGAAVFTVLLCLVMGLFIRKMAGRVAALLFLLFFSFCEDMIFFHMARSGDADAIYLFFFCAGMAVLYGAQKKKRYLLYLCFGLCFSFAFMAKAYHAGLMLLIAFIYVVLVKRQNTFRELLRILLAMVSGFAPLLIWAIIRFRFDGTAFIVGMFRQEVVNRVSDATDYGSYIAYYSKLPIVWLMVALLVLTGLGYLVKRRKLAIAAIGDLVKRRKLAIAAIGDLVKKRESTAVPLCQELSLLLVWILVAVGTYSISGAFNPWYGYAGLIAIVALISIVCARFLQKTGFRSWLTGIFGVCLLAGSIYFIIQNQQRFVDIFYENNPNFKNDIEVTIELFPEYAGHRLYIENAGNSYKAQNQWEQNLLLEALYVGNWQCVDGGVPVFIEDPEGVLILQKSLWPEYADILTGRVILVDESDYIVFINEFY